MLPASFTPLGRPHVCSARPINCSFPIGMMQDWTRLFKPFPWFIMLISVTHMMLKRQNMKNILQSPCRTHDTRSITRRILDMYLIEFEGTGRFSPSNTFSTSEPGVNTSVPPPGALIGP